jgi:hypothetical protein
MAHNECEWKRGEMNWWSDVIGRHVGLDKIGLLMEARSSLAAQRAAPNALRLGSRRPGLLF